MTSGDISVFWQEIIDSYRDIMVVRNTDKAKNYLDLTDGEFSLIKEISDNFSMSKLIYHTSVLENALMDMQRVSNAKRSIAEIALTRICDPRLMPTAESLLVRVEELEKKVAMLKMGVPLTDNPGKVQNEFKESSPAPVITEEGTDKQNSSGISLYSGWSRVLERISEIKKPLSSQFVSARAYKASGNRFVIEMNGFFAERIKNSVSDLSILKGVIAEVEGIDASLVTVEIRTKAQDGTGGFSSDLDNI